MMVTWHFHAWTSASSVEFATLVSSLRNKPSCALRLTRMDHRRMSLPA